MKMLLSILRTANEGDMRLSAAICTANIATVADGDWALIAPYGEHASPDGSYVQRFDRGQAEKMVKTWNSFAGIAIRTFKNAVHRRLGIGAPVWDGHPETDRQRWPKDKLLAEITDLRAGTAGLEGQITWNAKGLQQRTRGPLYPSPLWMHWPPSGEPPAVYPEVLESVGLVTTPNISAVPAWTANTNLAGDPQAENQNDNIMNEQQIMALRKALGLPESADFSAIVTSANAAQAALATLSTANSAKVDLESKLATANASLTTVTGELDQLTTTNGTLTTERDGLKTANSALTAERDLLLTGLLDLAEKRGIIAPAKRDAFKDRLVTANTAAAALTELQTMKPELNTKEVAINNNRVDITTANARQEAFNAAVSKRMKDDACDRDTAFNRCLADPTLSGLTGAMQDPTKKAA